VNRAAVTTVYGDLPALTVSVDLRPAAFSERLSETATERGRRGRWRTPVP
jgi:hypothetical protein